MLLETRPMFLIRNLVFCLIKQKIVFRPLLGVFVVKFLAVMIFYLWKSEHIKNFQKRDNKTRTKTRDKKSDTGQLLTESTF